MHTASCVFDIESFLHLKCNLEPSTVPLVDSLMISTKLLSAGRGHTKCSMFDKCSVSVVHSGKLDLATLI